MDTLNLYNGSRLTAHGELAHSQKLLSVIIPAYNTAKFLNKCVESVVNQTYKNIEIIIVDDGSSDSTPQICDELANKYNNIKIIHQENKGLAQTRGVGFNASRGEYIAFIDSDDYIDLNAYETAIKVLEENKCDMVQFGYFETALDGKSVKEWSKPDLKLNNSREIFKYFISGKTNYAVWNRIYKRVMLENITWPKISMAEDYCISSQIFAKATKFVSFNQSFYYYIQQPNNLTNQPFTNDKKRGESIQAHEFVANFTAKKFPEFLPEALYNALINIYNILLIYISKDYINGREVTKQLLTILKQDYKRMKQELKAQGRELYIDNSSFTRKQRVQLWLVMHCPKFYKYYLKLRLKIHALTGI